ncbi:hypothetical protein RBB79_09170 [Tunturiibacter empetritectus]|uniref:Uncharacterized protein n=1 Tax=Tunturiibacter lichenicola TaxID=2051959 RepID=A0A852VGZ7_9BACT|nr:hypothetical protein [Edaphobacter lichenicola]NYF89714.1 hypothetical protein [Edaphobacter lichenicola]
MLRRLSLVLLLLSLAPCLPAQRTDASLSDGEVEQLREVAYYPNDRVLLFIKLLDARNKSIQDLFAIPRKPGREQDTHDLLEQFTAIADELNDNLDDYGPRHRDIRKALPKLVEATERWSSNLKSPPDNETYNVSRRLALEAVHDLHDQATQLIDEQKAWFLAHPPPKENKNAPLDLPR